MRHILIWFFMANSALAQDWAIRDGEAMLDREQVLALFDTYDVLLAPATPCVPQRLWQEEIELEGSILPVRPTMGRFTQPLTLIGLPITVVPMPIEGEPLPIGLQIIAAPWKEADALRIAAMLQKSGIAGIRTPAVFAG